MTDTDDGREQQVAHDAARNGNVHVGRFYPSMPPALVGEDHTTYSNRLLGIGGVRPYDHARGRQCSLGWHDECSQNGVPAGERRCQCPHHTTVDGVEFDTGIEPDDADDATASEALALVRHLREITTNLDGHIAVKANARAREEIAEVVKAADERWHELNAQRVRAEDLADELRKQLEAALSGQDRLGRDAVAERAARLTAEHQVRILRVLYRAACNDEEDGYPFWPYQNELEDALKDPCGARLYQFVADDGPEGGHMVQRWCVWERGHADSGDENDRDHWDQDSEPFTDDDIRRSRG